MKILMIISEAPPIKSGMARVAEKLTQGLIKRGHTVDVLSANDIPRIVWGEIRISSMPVRLFKLKNQIKQYDLIHLHGVAPTFSATFLLWW